MKTFSAPKKFRRAIAIATLIGLMTAGGASAQTTTNDLPAPAAGTNAAVSQQELVRAYLAIQEQLHDTQLALERNRREAETAAGRNALALAKRLNVLERLMAEQRDEEGRTVLLIALSVTAAGFLAALLATLMQQRALKRLTELPLPAAALQLSGGEESPRLLGGGSAEANTRLKETIERLQTRVRELENATPKSEPEKPAAITPVEVLLAKGQAALTAGRVTDAVRFFDEALALAPAHAEALVKKGSALEKLGKLTDAITCYDRAIAADGALTIAYLNKGGALNRLERYNEALVCYEEALRSQERPQA